MHKLHFHPARPDLMVHLTMYGTSSHTKNLFVCRGGRLRVVLLPVESERVLVSVVAVSLGEGGVFPLAGGGVKRDMVHLWLFCEGVDLNCWAVGHHKILKIWSVGQLGESCDLLGHICGTPSSNNTCCGGCSISYKS